MWEEFKQIKSDKKNLRKFGLTIGAILVILGTLTLWRGKNSYPYLIGTGCIFIFFGVAAPVILKPAHKIWMGLSIILGFFVSRVILTFIFYLVMTPIGLSMRIFGRDILEERIERQKKSYWVNRSLDEEKDIERYEKQY